VPNTKPSVSVGDRLYASVADAATYLGVTDRCIRQMIADGRLTLLCADRLSMVQVCALLVSIVGSEYANIFRNLTPQERAWQAQGVSRGGRAAY
jgi:hypothetical protein